MKRIEDFVSNKYCIRMIKDYLIDIILYKIKYNYFINIRML